MSRVTRKFISDTGVSFALGSGVNVVNYLCVVLAARGLSVEGFGTLSALLACVTIATVLANAIQVTVTKTVAHGAYEDLPDYVGHLRRQLARGGVVGIAVVGLVSPALGRSLHAAPHEILLTVCAIVGTLFMGGGGGVLAGLRWLKTQAWVNFIAAIAKLALIFLLLRGDTGVAGVLVAYGIGIWLVYPLSLVALRLGTPVRPAGAVAMSETVAQRVTVFWGFLLATAPFMVDQVLVQVLVQPLSGPYGATATVAKLVFYAAAPILGVLLPYLASHRDDIRAQLRYTALCGAAALVVALGVTVVLTVGADVVVGSFLTERYLGVAPEVAPFAAGVVLYLVGYTIVIFFLARGGVGILLPLFLALAVQLALFGSRHRNLHELVENQLWSYAIFLALLSIYLVWYLMVRRRPVGVTHPVSETRKTIIYLHPHFTIAGGAGKYVLETGSRFAALGYRVVVVSIRAEDAIVGAYRSQIEFIDLGGALSSSLRFWALFPLSLVRVIRIVDRFPEAMIFAQVFPANWWGFVCKMLRPRRKLVWMCQEPSAFIHSRAWIAALPRDGAGFFARALNPVLRFLDVRLAQRADLVFTNSQFGQRYAREVYRYPEDKVIPTYLGVDHHRFTPREGDARRQIVTVGRLTEFKRVDVILRALRVLHDRGLSDLRLVVIGQGEAGGSLRRLSEELHLQSAVDFRGGVSDEELVEELRSSLALILASIEEPFGLVAVEAMACGIPAIVTATGGPAETVVDGESGFHVPPNDVGALADRIEALSRDAAQAQRLREGAVRRASLFTWEKTVEVSQRYLEALA